ncbi:hypothetical protein NKR17_17280 [Priestia flexa]|uniref:hypothetical protein n=1 Tax=Priestia flexa TaxID=86664 RepID=UPI00209C70F6|nr:hypothetical protein [Priestia flexa]MCP1190802.1 hypothetical protein [Priestia flexa]
MIMNKKIKHIAYYTKKVAQEGAKARPTSIVFRNKYRHDRLLKYKKMLNKILVN